MKTKEKAPQNSQSTSVKTPTELFTEAALENYKLRDHIKHLEEHIEALLIGLASRDLESLDKDMEIEDLNSSLALNESQLKTSSAQYTELLNKKNELALLGANLKRENTQLEIHNQKLINEIARLDKEILNRDSVLNKLKKMLSLQAEIMNDVGQLK